MRLLMTVFLGLASLAAATVAAAASPSPLWTTTGLQQPVSALYVREQQAVYVGNLGGDPQGKSGHGTISRIAPDGRVIKRDWFRGLHAPKGLGYDHGLLYVADLDTLLEIDTGNGRVRHRYVADGAKALCGVALDSQGRVYVSDPDGNAIWRLSGGEFGVWLQDPALNAPHGLVHEKGRLVVATAGAAGDTAGGYLVAVDTAARTIEPRFAALGFARLDGLAPDGHGGYYASDAGHGNVHHVAASGETRLWLLLEPQLAGLGLVPGQRLLVPNTSQGTVSAFTLDR